MPIIIVQSSLDKEIFDSSGARERYQVNVSEDTLIEGLSINNASYGILLT
jgi:hypothetical protein